MKAQIGFDAGSVWQHLVKEKGNPVTIKKLASVMKKNHTMTSSRLHMALGWLARENKVNLIWEEGSCEAVALAPQELA